MVLNAQSKITSDEFVHRLNTRGECIKALKIIECCQEICKQLLKDGQRVYADIRITDLQYDCSDWEQLELNVEKKMAK